MLLGKGFLKASQIQLYWLNTWLNIILSTGYPFCLTSHRRHVDIVAASSLLCQRCTYIKWNEGTGEGLMHGMWPSDCEHGVTLEDKETCPAGNRHVCALLVTSFSLIYSITNPINVTSPQVKPTVMTARNATAGGVVYIRGCMTEKLGYYSSLSDANRRYATSVLAQHVDQTVISAVEIVVKQGQTCTCNTSRCVAKIPSPSPITTFLVKTAEITTQPPAAKASVKASPEKIVAPAAKPVAAMAITETTTQKSTTTSSTTVISDETQFFQLTIIFLLVNQVLKMPIDFAMCTIVVLLIILLKLVYCKRRRRVYISTVVKSKISNKLLPHATRV